ncbi:hypothetical protein N9N28_15595 [Rubripirellula amarantea]|nr:hypothetical protein [Rubripirellula amarantea]
MSSSLHLNHALVLQRVKSTCFTIAFSLLFAGGLRLVVADQNNPNHRIPIRCPAFAITVRSVVPESENPNTLQIPRFRIVECGKSEGDRVWISASSVGWVERLDLLALEQAADYLAVYLEENTLDVGAHAARIMVHLLRGEYQKAHKLELELPASIRDASSIRYVSILVNAIVERDLQTARKQIDQLVKDAEQNDYWYAQLADLVTQASFVEEMPELTSLTAIHERSKSHDVQVAITKIALAKQQFETALSRCDKLLTHAPFDARLVWMKAIALGNLGRQSEEQEATTSRL